MTVPIILLIIAATVDFGSLIKQSAALAGATRIGAEYARFHSADLTGIKDAMQTSMSFNPPLTSVRLKREQIQLIALGAVVGFVFDSGNRLTEQHFFEERHGQDL